MSLLPQDRPASVPDERYTASYHIATATLVITGEIDETDAEQVRDDLRFLGEQYPDALTIDLSAVTYLPSRAIGVVVGAQNAARARGTEINLLTARDSISAKILAIVGLPFEER